MIFCYLNIIEHLLFLGDSGLTSVNEGEYNNMPEMIFTIKRILLSTVFFYLKSTHHKHIGDLVTIQCWWPIWHSIGPPKFRIVVIVFCKYYVTSDCPCQNFCLLLNCKIEMRRARLHNSILILNTNSF